MADEVIVKLSTSTDAKHKSIPYTDTKWLSVNSVHINPLSIYYLFYSTENNSK